jgi:[ribosomal protein S5]-alanine N-acetyltransferase
MEVALKPWHINDLNTLVKIANNANIAKYMADVFPHPYTIEKGKQFIEMATTVNTSKIFAISYNNTIVGSIGLHIQNDILRKNAEIGYWLAEDFWGKGIMSQAICAMVNYGFTKMDIVRIFARIYGTNIPSQKLIEKCNFKLEGKYEKTIFKNDEFLDELIYAIRK